MKTLKKIIFFTLMVPFFFACDLWDDDTKNYWASIATVENPDSLSTFFLRLDNNDLLWTEKTNFPNYRPKDGQRVIAYYTILSDKHTSGLYDYDIQLNNVRTVLTKDIFRITPETQDSIGNDSIIIDHMWIGSHYLNVQFVYTGYNQIHFINLVSDPAKVYDDGKVHLEFRHNSNGDSPVYYRRGYVSFRLLPLQEGVAADSLQLVVHVNTPNRAADTLFERTYHFNPSQNSRAPKLDFQSEAEPNLK
jgi:hypothetical protein